MRQTKQLGRLPVVNFAAGGVATPADAALMMQLGMDGVFVGSGIFKSGDPASRARAIVQVCFGCMRCCAVAAALLLRLLLSGSSPPLLLIPTPCGRGFAVMSGALQFVIVLFYSPSQAVTHYNNPKILSEVSCNLGEPMVGIDIRDKDFTSYAQRSE